ncbi:MAG: penicillin-binding protein activator LpoB [Puniceicoccales bacterium]|jgi:uncharacterized protein (TIGR02722 family)|nr:penicillin-binding protein activator LpoB [Puniceicoccales bacterium]
MKSTKLFLILGAATALTFSACAQRGTVNVDTTNDTAGATGGLDYRDFQKVASEVLQDLFRTQRLVHKGPNGLPDGKQYVVAIGKITNDTKIRDISTDQLLWKIREELTNSGQVLISSAVGTGDNVESAIHDARQLRGDQEFNQATVAKTGTLLAPDLIISGKIFQKNNRLNSSTTQAEYYFQLKISSVSTGTDFWNKEIPLVKRGDAAGMRLQQL